MKKFLLSFVLGVFAIGSAVPEAEAKRLGGGGSFGMQRQTAPLTTAPRAPAATAPQTPTAAAAKPKSSWMGPLAGLAAGLGLAALFAHLGLGEEFASLVLMLLLIGGAFLVFRTLTRTAACSVNRLQYAGAQHRDTFAPSGAEPSVAADSTRFPAGFDALSFAREAKKQFIRLQAAHDAGDLEDIRAFTTPEVFAEIRMQLAERGSAPQRTDVVELNAEVLEVAEENGQYIVSVRYSGLLREEADAAPAPFAEIWHLTKPVSGTRGWLIAGIQQLS